MGGEKSGFFPVFRLVQGSPPHGRGKDLHSTERYQTARITPAWAGKRELFETVCVLNQDHPRMGGEKS